MNMDITVMLKSVMYNITRRYTKTGRLRSHDMYRTRTIHVRDRFRQLSKSFSMHTEDYGSTLGFDRILVFLSVVEKFLVLRFLRKQEFRRTDFGSRLLAGEGEGGGEL